MTPRNNSLVYFDFDSLPSGYDKSLYPFKKFHAYIYLGEIPNSPGNCVVLDPTTNEVFTKFYITYFKEYMKGSV